MTYSVLDVVPQKGNSSSLIPLTTSNEVILFTFFGVLCLAELVFAFFEIEKARKIVKPFCTLFLALIALLFTPWNYFFVIGVLFGMVGDIFFIFKDQKKFILLGLVAFMLNHVFYILATWSVIREEIEVFHTLFLVAFFLLFFAFSFLALEKFCHMKGLLRFTGSIYMTLLVLDFAYQILARTTYSQFFIYSIFGGVLFIISDSILTCTLFLKDFKRRDFPIMLTYLGAQLLFYLPYLLLQIQAGVFVKNY